MHECMKQRCLPYARWPEEFNSRATYHILKSEIARDLSDEPIPCFSKSKLDGSLRYLNHVSNMPTSPMNRQRVTNRASGIW
jgi:hypothetical protein